MKFFAVPILVIMLLLGGQAIAAGRRPIQRVVRATPVGSTANTNGLIVVPFAVPVAVPVSVVTQPAVLYSYRQYAAPSENPSDLDEPIPGSAPSKAAPPASAPAPSVTTVAPAVALLNSRCAKCHSGESSPGHLQIFDAAGQILPRLPRRAILEMVSPDSIGRRRMPPKDLPKLTAEELTTLGEWARPPRDLAY